MKVNVLHEVSTDEHCTAALKVRTYIEDLKGHLLHGLGTLYRLIPDDITKENLSALVDITQDGKYEVNKQEVIDTRSRVKTCEITDNGSTIQSASFMPRYRAEQLVAAVSRRHPNHIVVLTSEQ